MNQILVASTSRNNSVCCYQLLVLLWRTVGPLLSAHVFVHPTAALQSDIWTLTGSTLIFVSRSFENQLLCLGLLPRCLTQFSNSFIIRQMASCLTVEYISIQISSLPTQWVPLLNELKSALLYHAALGVSAYRLGLVFTKWGAVLKHHTAPFSKVMWFVLLQLHKVKPCCHVLLFFSEMSLSPGNPIKQAIIKIVWKWPYRSSQTDGQ